MIGRGEVTDRELIERAIAARDDDQVGHWPSAVPVGRRGGLGLRRGPHFDRSEQAHASLLERGRERGDAAAREQLGVGDDDGPPSQLGRERTGAVHRRRPGHDPGRAGELEHADSDLTSSGPGVEPSGRIGLRPRVMLLIHAVAAALALSGPQAQPLPDQLVIAAVVTDKEGHPVTDLKPDEIVVQENGADRPTVRAERDARPLKVALVLDSSAAMGGAYASDVVPAAVAFLKRLPAGTGFTVWSTSDHPRRIVDEGTDLKAAEDKMRTLSPFGANAAVDTLVEASRDAGAFDDQRGAVVIVTSASMEGVTVDLQSLLPTASFKPTFAAVEVVLNSGDQDARLHDALKLMSSRTAGFHERVFTTMSIAAQLERVQDLLASQYRVAWKPGADPRQVKIEVKVKRPDTKVVQAMRISTDW